MALNVLASGSSATSSAETATTASFTPTAHALVFAVVLGQRDNHTQTFAWSTPTGGLTWSSHATTSTYNFEASSTYAIQVASWYATAGASPTSQTLTFDAISGSYNCYYSWLVFEITDFDSGATFPQSAVTNGAAVDPKADNQSGTLTLGSAPTSGNYVVGVFGTGNDVAAAASTPSGFSVIGTAQTQTYTKVNGFYRADTTATTITSSDLGEDVGNWAGIAFEVKVSGAAQSQAPRSMHINRMMRG
jgi:hypothetical protein